MGQPFSALSTGNSKVLTGCSVSSTVFPAENTMAVRNILSLTNNTTEVQQDSSTPLAHEIA
ncbi:MAG: hypothetical protein ACO3NM_04780, partial [bacterium]